MVAPPPANEARRLEALQSYEILDTTPEKEFDDLARLASQICGAPVALITLVDAARQWFKAKVGWDVPETSRDAAFCAHAILKPELLVVPDATKDERFADNPLVLADPSVRFYAGMPLVNKDGYALGTLCVIDRVAREQLTPMQEEALGTLGRQAVTQLELRRAFRELEGHRTHLEEMVDQRTKRLQAAMKRIESTYDETLEALGAALDLRDNETAGHSRRVTAYCLEIAGRMGCADEALKEMRRGSYLHDIGKIGIPDVILFKPGKLTKEEREVMETHARIGYELMSGIAFLAPAAQITLTHQERYDGTGYPQGLVGKEIPLGARIFSVADTLDAITSDRPYRRALSFEAAREEIKRESEKQFDPEVVEVFLSVPEEIWMRIRAEVSKARRSGVQAKWSL